MRELINCIKDGRWRSRYSSAEFRFISELLWGGVPLNRRESEESKMFTERADEILKTYPKLNESFYEINKFQICNKK